VKSSRWLWLAVALAAPACNLYNLDLLGDAHGDDGPSGGNASGGNDNTGGGAEDGGTNSGGGTGGTETGGDTGAGGMNMGGDNSGGGSESGGGTGGDDSGGGSGGDSGGGSGGTSGPPIGTIDDLEHATTASYTHLPFYGKWDRYLEPGGTWTATTVAAMVQARFDDATDNALHVQATTLDDWGVGVFLTLKNGGAISLEGVTGIRFDVATMNGETTLRVALADVASHQPACMAVNAGVDCDKHMRSVQAFAIDDTFQTVDLPMTTFIDKAVAAVEREADLDVTKVYALHFQFDPELAAVDFYLDNLETY